jgi:hypothetical protein
MWINGVSRRLPRRRQSVDIAFRARIFNPGQ